MTLAVTPSCPLCLIVIFEVCLHIANCCPIYSSQLKAVLLGSSLEVVAAAEVKFDTDLPEFRTTGGANAGSIKNE